MTDDIESITGIGPQIAENLRAAGFETADEVTEASVDELTEVELIGESTAEAIVAGDLEGRKGRDPTVEEHLDAVREQLEKPISDRAAIAQSPIGRKTHKEWLDKDGEPYEAYQEMYRDARAIAEERLAMDGLYGEADSSLVKFLLKATHGYQDKQTVEHEGDAAGITIDFNDVDT